VQQHERVVSSACSTFWAQSFGHSLGHIRRAFNTFRAEAGTKTRKATVSLTVAFFDKSSGHAMRTTVALL
jgi:hypothetical protein